MNESLEDMTGAGGNASSAGSYDIITCGGETGEIIQRHCDEKDDLGKAKKSVLPAPFEFSLLKMRFKLTKFVKDMDSFRSTEFDNKATDTVTVYNGKNKYTGTVEEMKTKYGLGTVVVVYAWVPSLQKVVKLEIKGLSYGGSENYPKDKLGWFDFLRKMNGAKLRVHEWILSAEVLKVHTKPNQFYYAIGFKRSRQYDADELVDIESKIREIHASVKGAKSSGTPEEEENNGHDAGSFESHEKVIDYSKEPINPDDIPF